MQDEQLREDAKQLLKTTYEQQMSRGGDVSRVDFTEGVALRGIAPDSPHLSALLDYMEVTGWIEEDPMYHGIGTAALNRRVTPRGLEVMNER